MAGLACRGVSIRDVSIKMRGTTLCPHCDTRFKITEAQLDVPNGMVRCGNCLRVFAARANFVAHEPDRQLKLPILDEPDEPDPSDIPTLRPMTLAEEVAIIPDEEDSPPPPRYGAWPWAVALLMLLLALLAQATYIFRVDLAARLPTLKPALVSSCRLFKCSVLLPQKIELLNIESSGLEADPLHDNQITLNALLRNRAPYTQAFPNLELTLNDTQDKPIARRVFRPGDYLSPPENEADGLLPNHDIMIKLHLNTTGLKPSGYRLGLIGNPPSP